MSLVKVKDPIVMKCSEMVCRYNKFGYRKFGNRCFKKHENTPCENIGCSVSDCPLRHPRKCRYFSEYHYCKFGTFCKFSHKIEESGDTKKQIKTLQIEIQKLKDKIKLMEVEIDSKSEEIKKMEEAFELEKKEKDDTNMDMIQMLIERFKKSSAIEAHVHSDYLHVTHGIILCAA